jgi:cytidylate kinase
MTPRLPTPIAIDGPASSGKSTVALELCVRIGHLFFDTGILYRAVAAVALQRSVALADEQAITTLTEKLAISVQPPTVNDGRTNTVLVDGVDVTLQLRTAQVDASVSVVAAYAQVRRILTEQMRTIARTEPVVMVGRDIGTVVLPDAPLKIYLDASAEERARRRHAENVARGAPSDLAQILAGIRERDRRDSERAIAPLQAARDAHIVDSTNLTPAEVVAAMERLLQAAASPPAPGPEPYSIPEKAKIFRAIAVPAVRIMYYILSRPHVYGLENVPAHGPYLITANHLSYYDPPCLLVMWPYLVEAIGASDMMTDGRFMSRMINGYSTLPAHRGAVDAQLMRTALNVLKSGRALYIAPEGARNPAGLGAAKLGAAYIALKANVPIVPVAITGTDRIFPELRKGRRQKVEMMIGAPYRLPVLPPAQRRRALAECTQLIMHRIAALLPPGLRGVYA